MRKAPKTDILHESVQKLHIFAFVSRRQSKQVEEIYCQLEVRGGAGLGWAWREGAKTDSIEIFESRGELHFLGSHFKDVPLKLQNLKRNASFRPRVPGTKKVPNMYESFCVNE